MRKQDIVVHIKDEQMLNEAREILESAGEEINELFFGFLDDDIKYNYLYCSIYGWAIADKHDCETEITLSQLKELLK
tara:strand:- start:118 stop:348 length:231 start_codon:yes stop_codon:yes gene_type:complete